MNETIKNLIERRSCKNFDPSRRVEDEKLNLILEAGKYAYEIWCENKIQADLTTYWNQVQDLDGKIAVQKAKKKEMSDRYDEEIQLIASNLNIAVSSNAPTVPLESASASCPNCGMAIADGDIFCQECGTKLQ